METLTLKRALRTALVWGACGALAWGQTPTGPNFQVNSHTTGLQGVPSIGVEPDGDFVIVWMSEGQDGSGFGTFGQRYAASGAPRGSEFRINAYATGAQGWPDVAVGSAGDFVVVWTSEQDGSLSSVHGRRYDASGNALGDEFQVNTYTTGHQGAAHVARAADGRFVVAWTSDGPDGNSFGISARRFDASGNPVGNEFVVNTSTFSTQYGGDVASDGIGNFVVVWESYYGGFPQPSDLFGQRFDAAGNRVGAEFAIGSGGNNYSPAVSQPPSGTFVVSWTGNSGYYYGRKNVLATNVNGFVNTFTPGDQFGNAGSIAHDGGGNFVITWTGDYQDGDSVGVFGQRFDGAGFRIGPEFSVNTYTTGAQGGAVVGADAAGNFVVAWGDDRADGDSGGIFAQRFSPQVAPASADLAIVKLGPAIVTAGSNRVVYSITVTNGGPSDAVGVQVADPTPTGLTFVSNTGSCTTPFPCALGTVGGGESRVITATFHVPAGYGGPNPIVNQATVTSTTPDPNAANDTDDASTRFVPATSSGARSPGLHEP